MDFGPKYIDINNNIEYESLAKKAIKIKNKNEMISEEMRLLYVALTRAKEQLIITGIEKNIEKSFNKKREIIESSKIENNYNNLKIPKTIIKQYKSFLDWIELIIINQENSNKGEKINICFNSYDMKQITKITKLDEKNNTKNKIKNILDKCKNLKENENVEKLLNWEYNYIKTLDIETKTSVTKLTKGKENQITEFKKPMFLNNKNDSIDISKADIGIAVHLLMQKLDFKEKYTVEKIQKLIKELLFLNIINEKQANKIEISKILKFTNSEIYKEITNAKKTYKEKSFYTEIEYEGEKVLLQGVIDLYFINKENDIILLDYKTDKVKNEEELIQRYKNQLLIYKKAIEDGYKKPVKKIYIYSIDLEKLIIIE